MVNGFWDSLFLWENNPGVASDWHIIVFVVGI